jgi:hypothetical protein
MKTIVVLAVIWGLLLPIYGFAQPDRSKEISQLIAGIESTSWTQRVNSAKIITRSGLQDQVLYQKVADLLKAGYSREYEKNHTDEMAWMCKALAASGDPGYRSLLNEVAVKAPNAKLRKYAKQSSGLIDQYARRSKILSAADDWDVQLTATENRLVSMLKSDNIGLRREAAKTIARTVDIHEKVFSVTAATLTGMSKDFRPTNLYVDTMAWLCKALASSKDAKYVEVLERVIDTTRSSKLRNYAVKARNAMR